jgi:hypothetical protein
LGNTEVCPIETLKIPEEKEKKSCLKFFTGTRRYVEKKLRTTNLKDQNKGRVGEHRGISNQALF